MALNAFICEPYVYNLIVAVTPLDCLTKGQPLCAYVLAKVLLRSKLYVIVRPTFALACLEHM